MATKAKMADTFPSAIRPSRLKTSRRKGIPFAGTWMNLWRPIQKITVARAMSTPGTPKAQCGPYHCRSHGVASIETKAPVLIEK